MLIHKLLTIYINLSFEEAKVEEKEISSEVGESQIVEVLPEEETLVSVFNRIGKAINSAGRGLYQKIKMRKNLAVLFFALLVFLLVSFGSYHLCRKIGLREVGEAKKKLRTAYVLNGGKLRELKRFVKEEAERGASVRQITANLVKAGWKKEMVRPVVKVYSGSYRR